VALPRGAGGDLAPAATRLYRFKVVHLPPVLSTLQDGGHWPEESRSIFLIETALFCAHFTMTLHENVIIQWSFLLTFTFFKKKKACHYLFKLSLGSSYSENFTQDIDT